MATKKMTEEPLKDIYTEDDEKRWSGRDRLSSAKNGVWIMIPGGIESISWALKMEDTGAAAKIQVTCSPLSEVQAGKAIVQDETAVLTDDTTGVIFPCSAIRQVNSGGTSLLEVIAQ